MSKVTAAPLYEGTFSVGTDKVFNRIQKTDPPKKGALKLSINPFLIQDESRNILFDTGIGDLFGHDTSIETILTNLEYHGVSDFEITDVFISHLHFDHMAGLAHRSNGYWELTFPDADVWVSRKGWEKLNQHLDKQDDDKQDFVLFLESRASLNFLDDEASPVPHVSTKTIGGHTEFHQALFYNNGDKRYLMAGDVIGTRGAINRTYAAKYDFDPQKSMKMRDELQKLALEEGYTLMAYHETDYPMFQLAGYDSQKGYTIKNIS